MKDLITEARKLCERATPGPWGSRIGVGKKYYVFTPSYGVRDCCCLSGGFEHESDAAFIARSRTLIPELCDALENTEKQLQEQFDKTGAWLEEYNEMKIALEKAEEQHKQLLHEVCNLARESVEREKVLAKLEAEVMARLEERHEVD